MTPGALDVLAIGETMVLLAPDPPRPLADADQLAVLLGGAESNVVTHLAALGRRVAWASRVGADPFGDRILTELTGRGVDCSAVTRAAGERTGLYAKDPAPGGTTVHYYRAGSAASRMSPEFVRGLAALEPRVVHVSGITAALSADCRAALRAIVVDRALGEATVSFDINYRPGLWSVQEAAPVLAELADAADLVFVGLDEAALLWGTETVEEVRARLAGPRRLVVKDGAREAVEFDGDTLTRVPAHRVDVVEPVGAGDAFAAGWLAALLDGRPAADRLRVGHLLASRVLGVAGDQAPLPTPAEIEATLARPHDRMLVAADRPSTPAGDLDTLCSGQRVMGILRGFGPDETVRHCELLWAAGIDLVEVPIQDDRGREAFRAAAARAREVGRLLGVGTIIDPEQVDWALAEGAAFAVAPGIDPIVSARAAQLGLPLIPGVASATDIQTARRAGHRWMKAFPAAVLGSDWIRAQRGPFPDVSFVATGGIDADNAAEFLDAGASIVALGASLARPDVIDRIASLIARPDSAP